VGGGDESQGLDASITIVPPPEVGVETVNWHLRGADFSSLPPSLQLMSGRSCALSENLTQFPLWPISSKTKGLLPSQSLTLFSLRKNLTEDQQTSECALRRAF
jgi:hypothetical protein